MSLVNVDLNKSRAGLSNVPASRPGLACERCKRRKIRCDRALPACRICVKMTRSCTYPSVSQKPGPKPGAPQRRKLRKLNVTSTSNLSNPDFTETSNSGAGDTGNISATGSGQNRHGSTAHYQDGSAEKEDHQQNSRSTARHLEPPISPVTGPERSPPRGLTLSQLLHPSHEPMLQVSAKMNDEDMRDGRDLSRKIGNACKSLGITMQTYLWLLSTYFEKMTAFSLFHHPTFENKLLAISSPLQLQALLASMFSFSARFKDISYRGSSNDKTPSPGHFYDLAERSVDDGLRECSEDPPPLCLLQALILTTYEQLTKGVRSQAWRSVGTCVRIAYELQLHLIDRAAPNTPNASSAESALNEELRRAWWVIWEFDVFASTIRRLPTAIDWADNETWLPIDDKIWFANTSERSCPLNPDGALAWKSLENSGNKSPKAWFIVLNALMRCAHLLSYPQSYSTSRHQPSSMEHAQSAQSSLDVLANSLYCISLVLPAELSYHGDFLNFSISGSGRNSLQIDEARHSIHIMTQLSRFMIHHHQVFTSTSQHLGIANTASGSNSPSSLDRRSWSLYLAAATEIVTIIRNSSTDHVKYVNPFLVNTIWLAAAAQIVSKIFQPPLAERRVSESNLDLLTMNLNCYVRFWGVSSTLQQKLSALGTRLESFRGQDKSDRGQRERSEELRGSNLQNESRREPGGNPPRNLPTTSTPYYPPVPSIQQSAQVDTTFLNPNEGFSSGPWTVPQGFSAPESGMDTDIVAELWGWGLDELLTYGGLE